MSDLHVLLPDFSSFDKYASLLTSLETHRVSLSELLTLDAAEIGKRTRLPLLDLQRLCDDIRTELLKTVHPAPKLRLGRKWRTDSGETDEAGIEGNLEVHSTVPEPPLGLSGVSGRISTLDPALDAALGGGFPAGILSEIVGESGVGKTQLLLSLLVAVQLPPPRGLGRKALYIATEAPLATRRLTQIIQNNPDSVTLQQHCSLQSIVTINVPDLEAQEHILTHQLPVQLSKAEQYGGPSGSFGLVILDSVAANFRPFYGGRATNNGIAGTGGAGTGAASKDPESANNGGAKGSTSLAARGMELQRLGTLLRALAQKHNLAIVVANQVGDRFSDGDGLDGGDSGGGLLSLSQQWGASGATGIVSSSVRGPKHESSAKKLRQEDPYEAAGDNGLSLAHDGETPGQQRHLQPSGEANSMAVVPTVEPDAPATPAVPPVPMLSQPEVDAVTDDNKLVSSQVSARPTTLVKSEASDADPMPFTSSQYIPPSQLPPTAPAPPVLQLDHQQRWFTGWGDSLGGGGGGARNKTPSLGLVWAVQLGMRVALIKAPRLGRSRRHPGDKNYFPGPHDAHGGPDDDEEEYDEETVAERHNMGAPRLRHSWRRWLKVVFAPHVASTGASMRTMSMTAADEASTTPPEMAAKGPKTHRAVEFEITAGGLSAIK